MANYELIALNEAGPDLRAPTASDTGTIAGNLSVSGSITGGAISGTSLASTNGSLVLGTADASSGHINSFELLTFNIDTDNDDTDRYFGWYKDGSSGSGTELMILDESGNLDVSGSITGGAGTFGADTTITKDGSTTVTQLSVVAGANQATSSDLLIYTTALAGPTADRAVIDAVSDSNTRLSFRLSGTEKFLLTPTAADFKSNAITTTGSITGGAGSFVTSSGATALSVQQDAAQRALFIDQNGEGNALFIDSEATGLFTAYMTAPTSSGILFLDNAHASTPNGLLIDFSVASPNDTAQYFAQFQDSTEIKAVIYSDGGGRFDGATTIGDASVTPDGTLHVYSGSAGTVTANGNADDLIVEAGSGSDGGVSILTSDSQGGWFGWGSPSNNLNAALYYSYGGGIQVQTRNAGNNIVFKPDNAVTNLTLSGASGSELAEFEKDVHVGGGISFDAGSNLLDDYEEGTSTTTVTPETSGTITLGSGQDALSYVKVGALVTVTGTIGISSVGSPVGGFIYISLPFQCDDLTDTSERAGGGICYSDAGTRSVEPYFILGGTSDIRLYIDASTLAASDEFQVSVSYRTAS